jgi:hypothetical protein
MWNTCPQTRSAAHRRQSSQLSVQMAHSTSRSSAFAMSQCWPTRYALTVRGDSITISQGRARVRGIARVLLLSPQIF